MASNTPRIDEANLESAAQEKIQDSVNAHGRLNGVTLGQPVPVVIDGQPYECLTTELPEDAQEIPMCMPGRCPPEIIHKVCQEEGWPPGHTVLICDPVTGECCNCLCQ